MRLASKNQNSSGTYQIVGVSPLARRLRADIAKAAGFASSVHISGPTGTGKELVARALHTQSLRADKAFIPVNCAAISPSLFASHLFGHVKGSFTGADIDTLGCFRAADGGTIFLDEIGELDLELQAKLLRVLQERVVVPVGSYDEVAVNVRVISATNHNLAVEARRGRFREDLYYRLNVVTLRTAPLADRRDDIPVLAEHCLERLAVENGMPRRQLSKQALQWMSAYPWPGNVRQLQNVLERSVIFAEQDEIGLHELHEAVAESLELEDLPLLDDGPTPNDGLGDDGLSDDGLSDDGPGDDGLGDDGLIPSDRLIRDDAGAHPELDRMSGGFSSAAESPPLLRGEALLDAQLICRLADATSDSDWLKLSDLERYHIQQTLKRTYFNQTAAASLLGITYRSLSRKIRNYEIDVSQSHRGRPRRRSAL